MPSYLELSDPFVALCELDTYGCRPLADCLACLPRFSRPGPFLVLSRPSPSLAPLRASLSLRSGPDG